MFEAMDGEGEFGLRLRSFLGCWNGREDTVLLEAASPLEATVVVKEEAAAAREARLDRPGLTIFTDGSRLENGATGYAVVWKKGSDWEGLKSHMGWGQEAYDAECAGLARALQVAATRGDSIGAVTIFSDAQAAIARMTTDKPGPGQQYALEARRHIATLQAKEPNAQIEIRWCPSHQGIEGHEMADEWAKLAATSRTPMVWSGSQPQTQTAQSERESSPSRGRWPMPSEGSPSRSGETPRAGRGKNLPGPTTGSTGPVRNGSPIPRWPRPGSASRPASTS